MRKRVLNMGKPLLPFIILLIGCSPGGNRNPGAKIDSLKIGKIRNVVILGNSIVQQGRVPEIGWMATWGMAASSADSDFVHRLMAEIRSRDGTVRVRYKNIAGFERNYRDYLRKGMDSADGLDESYAGADLLIVKLSENVIDADATDSNFIYYYDQLIRHIDRKGDAAKVIVDGFWQKKRVNALIREYAEKNDYSFVRISDLYRDAANTAKGKFADPGVAAHPSDKGMKLIADRIWGEISIYFK